MATVWVQSWVLCAHSWGQVSRAQWPALHAKPRHVTLEELHNALVKWDLNAITCLRFVAPAWAIWSLWTYSRPLRKVCFLAVENLCGATGRLEGFSLCVALRTFRRINNSEENFTSIISCHNCHEKTGFLEERWCQVKPSVRTVWQMLKL